MFFTYCTLYKTNDLPTKFSTNNISLSIGWCTILTDQYLDLCYKMQVNKYKPGKMTGYALPHYLCYLHI